MTFRQVAVVVVCALALAGCTPEPTGHEPCPPTLVTDHTDASLTATTAPLSQIVWPLADVGPVSCTAELTVVYGDGRKVESAIALVNAPIADVTADLDALTADLGWTRNDPGRIWTDPDDAGHRIQIREIEEGTLVGITR
jgi:hypothetical protein